MSQNLNQTQIQQDHQDLQKQQRRKRGYSLRSQLFFKNADKFQPDLESGFNNQEQDINDVELESFDNTVNHDSQQKDQQYRDQSHGSINNNENKNLNDIELDNDDEIRQRTRLPIRKAYAGQRGKIQERFTTIKNFVLNIRPYKNSKDGRKIPISILKDYNQSNYQLNEKGDLIDERYNQPYLNNTISSSRYSLYSFLPKQLYAQFSKIANIYFMTVSILQMIPSWSTTGTYTTIIPLLVFISISMLREAFDDWRRNVQDKRENNNFTQIMTFKDNVLPQELKKNHKRIPLTKTISQTSVAELNPDKYREEETEIIRNNDNISDEMLNQPNTFNRRNFLDYLDLKIGPIKWKHIKVGDIIKLKQDEPVPADIIILTSDGENENEVFVETMDLDGETNLKSKSPLPKVSEIVNTATGLKNFKADVIVEDPNLDLYNFEGNLTFANETYPLGPENVIYRGSIIRNTQNVVGLVIFTGEETKIRMNAIKNPRTKAPKLQKSINIIVGFMVLVVVSLSLFSFMAQRINLKHTKFKAWYIYNQEAGVIPTIMSFVIMYNTLIPLSLYVTTEFIKLVQMMFLHWDIDMYHQPSDTPCEARTATILEELGQVSYIFSDKTGTLTDNLMVFRKFSIGGTAWLHETECGENKGDDTDGHIDETQSIGYKETESPRISVDLRSSHTRYSGRPSLAAALSTRNSMSSKEANTNPIKEKDYNGDLEMKTTLDLLEYIQQNPNSLFSKRATFFILSLALCHTCLPKTIDGETEDIEYQSSSPDELALVLAARDMGFVVFSKNLKELTIRTYPNGFDEDPVDKIYEVLNVVEFTSSRKRMSIIVKFPDGRICMICKGADNIILERLKNTELADKLKDDLEEQTQARKAHEAEVVLKQRKSIDVTPRKSFQFGNPRPSFAASVASIDDLVQTSRYEQNEIDDVVAESRKSLHLQQRKKYNIKSTSDYIGNILNEEYVLERTLQHIEEFSTEGLRTLLYGYKWLQNEEYERWAFDYASAKTSLADRSKLIEQVGGVLENNLELLGATAIEDKLQEGVSDTIGKLNRAGIKLWMLTGDKRETAINIGYSCKLIKDYSTLVVLDSKDKDVITKMNAAELEISNGNVAHCVVVIDGATLADFEADNTSLSMLISLCTKTDSVIVCRASPSQKALMVSSIRNLDKKIVTLAIGDGANDIAMIQSADIGIGITGKEGLQAARCSDYSIAQFRYLQKLLLVHGRYNYIRTSKFVLATFYKEVMFYLSQAIFQRNTMWTGTSLYEPWSLSMFNTLFSSLTVLCIGMFEKDLQPATLIAVPELYEMGRLSQAFNLKIFLCWMIISTTTSLMICFTSWSLWGNSATLDNNIYPLGVLSYTAIVFTVNIKFQFLEQRNITYLNFLAVGISCLGWLVWCCILPALYKPTTSKIYDVKKGLYWKFGKDITFWATLLILVVIALLYDTLLKVFRNWVFPSNVDEFQIYEKKIDIRKNIEIEAYDQMKQSWTWPKDHSSIKKLSNINYTRKRKNTVTLKTELPPGTPSRVKLASAIQNDGIYETEVLPSGKIIKRKIKDSSVDKLGKKLKFIRFKTDQQDGKDNIDGNDEDIEELIRERVKNLN
ncbi:hypothetical protein WICMUC_003132 [Wickerhamomyces mucosus]|uniref:Phospholipid-transporting ATPase n=1 Tax=Wickerhamomyces mucosus TaxID=1378264 RepID=A0A9P8TDR5_9ASCO|nr:hypothetical protein WICMUC_003132 [Wickerhamomyces mucosus]